MFDKKILLRKDLNNIFSQEDAHEIINQYLKNKKCKVILENI